MINNEQDPPNADFATGYIPLLNEDNQTPRNYVVVTYKQIISTVLCISIVIVLLLIVIIIILLKTYNQTPYITYNTTATSVASITTTLTSTIAVISTPATTTTEFKSKIESKEDFLNKTILYKI